MDELKNIMEEFNKLVTSASLEEELSKSSKDHDTKLLEKSSSKLLQKLQGTSDSSQRFLNKIKEIGEEQQDLANQINATGTALNKALRGGDKEQCELLTTKLENLVAKHKSKSNELMDCKKEFKKIKSGITTSGKKIQKHSENSQAIYSKMLSNMQRHEQNIFKCLDLFERFTKHKEAREEARVKFNSNLDNLSKIQEEIIDVAQNMGDDQQIEESYAAIIKGGYKAEEAKVLLEKVFTYMHAIAQNTEDREKIKNYINKLESLEQDQELSEEFGLPNTSLRDKKIVADDAANIIIFNPSLQADKTALTPAEYFIGIHYLTIENIAKIASKLKLLVNEDPAYDYLLKFIIQDSYDCGNKDFIQDLDQVSQQFIKNINKKYHKKGNLVNKEFSELSAAVAITFSNFKKIKQLCLSLKSQIENKYGKILTDVKNQYPGIKALHNHKIYQHRFDGSAKDSIGPSQNKSGIVYSAEAITSFKEMLKKDDYEFAENLDLLIFILKRFIKEIDKLVKQKIIATVNYVWEHKKPGNDFLAFQSFVNICNALLLDLLPKMENDPNFNGWE